MRRALLMVTALTAVLLSSNARADWHTGKVVSFWFGYDGNTTMVLLSGWNRNNCTCYPAWPSYMCLDRSRASYKEEFAFLLASHARDKDVQLQIDETTCRINAFGGGT